MMCNLFVHICPKKPFFCFARMTCNITIHNMMETECNENDKWNEQYSEKGGLVCTQDF